MHLSSSLMLHWIWGSISPKAISHRPRLYLCLHSVSLLVLNMQCTGGAIVQVCDGLVVSVGVCYLPSSAALVSLGVQECFYVAVTFHITVASSLELRSTGMNQVENEGEEVRYPLVA